MSTFKEYRAAKKEQRKDKDHPPVKDFPKKKSEEYPSMETSFGSHSVPRKKSEEYPSMETSFGSHSVPKKKLSESVVPEEKEPGKEYHEHVHTNAAKWVPEASTVAEKTAVKRYTDDSYRINKALRGHKATGEFSDTTPDYVKSDAVHLDSVLSKHKTAEPFHVYTGLKYSPSRYFKEGHDKTGKAHLPAYTSTSTSLEMARSFTEDAPHYNDELHGIEIPDDDTKTHHVLKIHVPKGTHAVSVKKISFVPGEHEVLLHRGHNVHIDPTPTKFGKDTHVWHAHIVGHEPEKLSG